MARDNLTSLPNPATHRCDRPLADAVSYAQLALGFGASLDLGLAGL